MNNGNIPYRSIAVLLFTVLLSSCLKETAVPIESTFTIEASEDKTSPVTIQLKNESYGADEYEWTLERGLPSSSTNKSPSKVVFTQAGVHKLLYSHPLKTIFQHKACTDKLYADSFYKVQKNSHSSFEVICCRR